MPKRDGLEGIVQAAARYREARAGLREHVPQSAGAEAALNRLLVEVDAEVLKAYDLPPRLERRLLDFFRGHEHGRRVGHHRFEG